MKKDKMDKYLDRKYESKELKTIRKQKKVIIFLIIVIAVIALSFTGVILVRNYFEENYTIISHSRN